MISIVESAYVWQCAYQRYSGFLQSVAMEMYCEVVLWCLDARGCYKLL